MSILIVELTSKGLIFGADKNVSIVQGPDSVDPNVPEIQRKVQEWPNGKAIIGYAGEAEIDSTPMDKWLHAFMVRNDTFTSLEQVSEQLKNEIESQLAEDHDQPLPLIIHIGGFEKQGNIFIPKVFFITNAHGMEDGNYSSVDKNFYCSEEIWKPQYFGSIKPENLKEYLRIHRDNELNPFWFHHGYDVYLFNVFHTMLLSALKILLQIRPKVVEIPSTLDQWKYHIEMQILTYSAYFTSYIKKPIVGGGVDIISLQWPE